MHTEQDTNNYAEEDCLLPFAIPIWTKFEALDDLPPNLRTGRQRAIEIEHVASLNIH